MIYTYNQVFFTTEEDLELKLHVSLWDEMCKVEAGMRAMFKM